MSTENEQLAQSLKDLNQTAELLRTKAIEVLRLADTCIMRAQQIEENIRVITATCDECNGTGFIEEDDTERRCPVCGGTGDSSHPARIHTNKADCDCTKCLTGQAV